MNGSPRFQRLVSTWISHLPSAICHLPVVPHMEILQALVGQDDWRQPTLGSGHWARGIVHLICNVSLLERVLIRHPRARSGTTYLKTIGEPGITCHVRSLSLSGSGKGTGPSSDVLYVLCRSPFHHTPRFIGCVEVVGCSTTKGTAGQREIRSSFCSLRVPRDQTPRNSRSTGTMFEVRVLKLTPPNCPAAAITASRA